MLNTEQLSKLQNLFETEILPAMKSNPEKLDAFMKQVDAHEEHKQANGDFFGLYWMNQHHKDWTDELLFRTKREAEDYLKAQGYALNGGWYTREPLGWEGMTRALVTRMKIFSKEG